MSEAQWTYLDGYVRDLANRMLLADWEIIVSREPCDEAQGATIEVEPKRTYALLKIQADFWDADEINQRTVMVHELIHCHTARMVDAIRITKDEMAGSAYMMLYDGHDRAEEIAVNQLARIIAPHMPLCDLPPNEAAPTKTSTKARH